MKFYIDLDDFITIESRKMLAKLTSNRNLLLMLASSTEMEIQKAVLENALHCDSIILDKLADSTYYEIRKIVAGYPGILKNTIKKLSNDIEATVREEIAININESHGLPFTVEILDYLSDDSSVDVRYAVTDNPYTSKETLDKMLNDPDCDVRQNAFAERERFFEVND